MEHRGPPRAEARRTCGLDADETHLGVVEEAREEPDGVRAAADARDDSVWEPLVYLEHLRAGFPTDDGLQLSHDARVRRRADAGADQVVRRLDVRDPVADRLARRLLQGLRPELDRLDLGAEKPHALDVRMLPAHVLGAHVDDALEPETSADRRGGDAVLSCARLRDDAALAEARREQDLAERVVDLVCASVIQILALEDDPAAIGCEAFGLVQRGRSPDVVPSEPVELLAKRRIRVGLGPPALELVQRRDERLGDVAAAVVAVGLGHRAAST